jgi:hypothetical protein
MSCLQQALADVKPIKPAAPVTRNFIFNLNVK